MEFIDQFEVLTATEASRSFSELLHRVCYGGQSFIIKKGNRLMAKVVPVEVVEEAVAQEETPVEQSAPAEPPVIESPKPVKQETPTIVPRFASLAEPARPIFTYDDAEYLGAVIDEQRKIPVPVDD